MRGVVVVPTGCGLLGDRWWLAAVGLSRDLEGDVEASVEARFACGFNCKVM